MALTGYRRKSGKRSGGVRNIMLVEAESITDVTFDTATDCYTGVELASGARFANYQFVEDKATYTEISGSGSGSFTVKHMLEFVLERHDPDAMRAVDELADASIAGMVALVTTSNNVTYLVGYSEKFQLERPLRLEKSSGTTGSMLSDRTVETVVLSSEDISHAKPFTGDL